MNLSLSLFLLLPLPQLASSFFQFSGFTEALAEHPRDDYFHYLLFTNNLLSFDNEVLAKEGLCTWREGLCKRR